MANSQRISDLSGYNSQNLLTSDLFIVSSPKGDNSNFLSYKLTFGELYGAIKAKLISELSKEWANLPVLTSLAAAAGQPHDSNLCCLGPGVAQDLSALIETKIREYVPKWQ